MAGVHDAVAIDLPIKTFSPDKRGVDDERRARRVRNWNLLAIRFNNYRKQPALYPKHLELIITEVFFQDVIMSVALTKSTLL